MDIAQIKQTLLRHHPDANIAQVDEAYELARQAHHGQYRDSGEPFITHPLQVAGIVASLRLDVPGVVAALLHDTVEDTDLTINDVERRFGAEVSTLVDGVTKLNWLGSMAREDEQSATLRKMFIAMAKDLRVVLIKLADRLHNMRTLKYTSPERQRKKARETMEIYAPLAHRLGMYDMKWELEDLSFRYLEPDRYREVANLVQRKRTEREEMTSALTSGLATELGKAGVAAEVSGRPKHFYSIYKKMQKGRDISEIYDMIAIRVIVSCAAECYAALGVIHERWKPLPGRVKDYIATPKLNMYQSLHTTVIGPFGEPFEIQIRTHEMHRMAESGVASHWTYKEGQGDASLDNRLSWLRSLLEWHEEVNSAKEFVEAIKVDLFADQIFVFTPKGRVVILPRGACPIDFAYRIHSEIGNRCVGAKVHGRLVPLDAALKSGEIVEIMTNKQSLGPSLDWLQIVRTPEATHKIRQFFKRDRREENLRRGKEALDREIYRLGHAPSDLIRPSWVESLCQLSQVASEEELYVGIGVGSLSAQSIANRLLELRQQAQATAHARSEDIPVNSATTNAAGDGVIRVRGEDDFLTRLGRCCMPVPGDPVIGFVTRGRGVTIHRLACPNLPQLAKDGQRLTEAQWEESGKQLYPVAVQVLAQDRAGLMADVAAVVAGAHINVCGATIRVNHGVTTIDLVVEVENLSQLQPMLHKLSSVRGAASVERIAHKGN